MTLIVNSVHMSNYSLHRRRLLLSVVLSIESESSELDDMTVVTPILNSVHTSSDSLQRRRVPVCVVTSIDSDCSEQSSHDTNYWDIGQCARVKLRLAETTLATQRGHQQRK
jgi:hypothetical protein